MQPTSILKPDSIGKPVVNLDPASVYGFGHLIRSTEELILRLFSKGLLSGTTHTCIGQELCQMSVVRALNHPEDAVLSNHRNHGHFLTYSGDFLGLVGEIMGRDVGVCGGYGGSQHIAYRNFHSNGVQGGMCGIGVGLAKHRQLSESDGVVAVMLGDGTTGQGLLYESLNLAGVWELPILFVVENNQIAQTTPTAHTVSGKIQDRGTAFGLETWHLDDASGDFLKSVDEIVNDLRKSPKPGLMVIDTKRMGPHSKGDDLRDESEMLQIRERDPLAKIGELIDDEIREQLESSNSAFLREVEREAMVSPEARLTETPATIFDGYNTEKRADHPAASFEASNKKVRESINEALKLMLQSEQRVLLLGEDLHDPYGGAFKVTEGLSSAFTSRVVSTPISEAGIVGAAIGLALEGNYPVVEIMFADFLTLAMDQLYNHAVKFPGMFEDVEVPLVIRAPCGGRRGYGPTHSQSPEALFLSVPGVTVVYGSHRHDVGQLLIDSTLLWRYPTLFFEHKLLYSENNERGEYVPQMPAVADPGAAIFPTLRRSRENADITLVTYGGMLPMVERVAEYLETEEELSVEILVPSLLSPLPKNTLLSAMLDQARVAIIEESHVDGGFGSELLACLAEAGFRGSTLRIGAPPIPIPSARSLEHQVLPDEREIIQRLLKLF